MRQFTMANATPQRRGGRAQGAGTRDVLAADIASVLSGTTVVECLARRAEEADVKAFSVESLDAPCVSLTVGEMLVQVSRAAQGMSRLGLRARDRAMIVLPTGVDFVLCFWGTLFAGATPVPAYPPVGMHQLPAFREKLARMAAVVSARLIIMPEMLRTLLAAEGTPTLAAAALVTPEEVWQAADGGEAASVTLPSGDDLALIQFSSGSTGDPRAVCLTHRNILTNMRAFLSRMRMQLGDVCVSWLPMYHDMGLIGTMMGAFLSRTELVLIPPTDFLRRPALWLEMMGKYRATVSVAPQFAYNLCVRKVDPATLPGVDLSNLRVVLNGAEPIDARGVAVFQRQFRALGLRAGVVTPCYGLAEGTLAASMRSPGQRVRTFSLASDGSSSATKLVCVGRPMNDTEIRIRGPRGAWLDDGSIGEICLRGPAVATGYLGVDGLQPATDRNGWLATGDLGFLDEGELFVTGRLKDLIIMGGRNVYPQDIEAAAAEVPGLRPGRIAAFGIAEPDRATEVLVLLAEFTDAARESAASAASMLRQRLRTRFAVTPYDIMLLRRGQIPLTTSGKIRRSQARLDYQRGAFANPVYHARMPMDRWR
ncbi:MAG TPA: fatty acyl-AMP ligase [Candidatus Margulisiibacteriota bacterium]|nr:fatty acyl-AMP ligase [Candidatus Margulisiibacteriota bacterium]